MKINKYRLKELIQEVIKSTISKNTDENEKEAVPDAAENNNEDQESEEELPSTSIGENVLYVFDFDDCLVDSSSRRGISPSYDTGTFYKTGRNAGQPRFKAKKTKRMVNGKEKDVTIFHAWMRSRDYDALKRANGGKSPTEIKAEDKRFRTVSVSHDYELSNKEGKVIIPKVTIESKPIMGSINAYKKAEASGSRVIIITSRIAFQNPRSMPKYLKGLGINSVEPYFAKDTTTTKGQMLAGILGSPGFENIDSVVLYEDNIEKLLDMKNTVIGLGLTAEAILVVGNEDVTKRTHPNISDGTVTYTYRRV